MSGMPCPFCDATGLLVDENAPITCPTCQKELCISKIYRVKNLLGTGGMGRVYRATHNESGEQVAIKMLSLQKSDWKAWELFERSSRVLLNLKHPSVPKIYGFDEDENGRFFLVSEVFEGGTLEEHVAQGKRLQHQELVKIFVKLCELLSYLHDLIPPVYHRDIKPSNIMFRQKDDLSPVLVDFDTVAAPGRHQNGLTIVGTPGYTAPEQFSGIITPASDLYSLGMTMLFVALHVHPDELKRDDEGRVILGEREKLSLGLKKILYRLVEPERSRRYTHAQQVLRDLENLDNDGNEKASPLPVAKQKKTPKSERNAAQSSSKNYRSLPRSSNTSYSKKNLSSFEKRIRAHNEMQVASTQKGDVAKHQHVAYHTPVKRYAKQQLHSSRRTSLTTWFVAIVGVFLVYSVFARARSVEHKQEAVVPIKVIDAVYEPKAEEIIATEKTIVDVNEERIFIPLLDSPTLGSAKAPVTIVVYSDFECPFCIKYAKTLQTLLAQNPGKIRLAFKHYPLVMHKNAKMLHKSAIAAGFQGKFWELHDIIYLNKKITKAQLEQEAIGLKLDIDRFRKDRDQNPITEQILERDFEELKRLGERGIPISFVNGVRVKGAQSLSALEKIVKEEIILVLKATRQGVLPGEMYEHLSKKQGF